MLRRQPRSDKHQMLTWYVGEYKPKTSNDNFKAAKEVLITAEIPMIENRRFERINNMIACKSYMKHENVPENKEVFVYGFKHIKTDKIDNYELIGSESDELNENKLINFCSSNFMNRDRKE